MLDAVRIENYRALRNVSVPLAPLTVLIGPNDSGKSAFLAALDSLARQPHKSFQESDHWQYHRESEILIAGMIQSHTIQRRGKGNQGFDLAIIERELRPVSLCHLLSRGVPMQAPGRSDSEGPPCIEGDGSSLAALVDYLVRREHDRFKAMEAEARRLIPGLRKLEVVNPDPSLRRLDLIIEHGLRIEGERASSGVRALLVFLALTYHPTPPALLLLEEPETAVHPRRLGDVMALLREITQGKHGGRRTQVIMTTHSPYLLDHVKLDTDQVLIFERNDDGSCSAEPIDKERLSQFLDEFQLGEVWFNQEEKGLVARK